MFRGLRSHTNTMVFHGYRVAHKAVREYSVINTPSPKCLKKPSEKQSDYKYPGKTITTEEKHCGRSSIISDLARFRFIWTVDGVYVLRTEYTNGKNAELMRPSEL